MPEQQFKRNIAFKLRIGDILIGKPVFDGERFSFLEIGDRKIIRVNIVGNIVEKFESEGDKKFSNLTLDDGSGQIKAKAFSEDTGKLKNFNQGQTILIIGVLRSWNNETYILPEIIKEIDSRYLLIRKLEIEKGRNKNSSLIQRKQIIAIKDKLLDLIKKSEPENGIEIEKIIMETREVPPDVINQEIKKLLEDGIIFEPRPGKVRWLG